MKPIAPYPISTNRTIQMNGLLRSPHSSVESVIDTTIKMPAHGRGAGLAEVALRSVFADELADLHPGELFDHPRPQNEADQEAPSGWRRSSGT